MSDFQLEDTVCLSIFKRNNASNPQSGLNISVKVCKVSDGTTLLNTTTLPESVNDPGLYKYDWTHGCTVKTYCVAHYIIGGNPASYFDEYFWIDDMKKKMDDSDGRAV